MVQETDPIDRRGSDVVLIVDDVPDNLSVLHDALDEAGYTVLVATSGEAALQRAAQAQPDIVLLDAVMPGLDGFEVARRLKAAEDTAHIPIVFMTGLTDTEHVVSAFQAGGVDYVTKPIRAQEVLARMAVHVQGARQARHARNALDAFGHATLVVRGRDGRIVWQTPLARSLVQAHFGAPTGPGPDALAATDARPPSGAAALPPEVVAWAREQGARQAAGRAPEPLDLTLPPRAPAGSGARLIFTLHEPAGDDEWLVVMRERSDQAVIDALGSTFRLTAREAEVLYWLAKGKTNRDIGDILGTSPATVKKQLEHVYEKLGVETRNAAASMAMGRVRGLTPSG
ncbi:response regulator transcription factor [Piscinibacter sakaiensis]|uniref:Two-component response regulator n=1 Tax=Piscinibacter sakaiensis TaxID=1547922 RepID=A0A0K8NX94_PISS1|nr:response regulator transcription factor [Piscinibacter sakaiensis]GAP34998.1 two-component response regulator [Piscinibacter sakaiensis]